MSNTFRPIGLAAAVAVVSAGFAGVTSAQEVSSRNVGDLGIVPYYTTANGYNTGIHIINTTEATQVVKLRLRRGSDSLDALDFNLIMSPKDEWVGSIQSDEKGVFVETDDKTCTAPSPNEGTNRFRMPDTFAEGAGEGYIEVIGMAQADQGTQIAKSALHKAGEPDDCANVRANFFRVDAANAGMVEFKGVHNAALTTDGTVANMYTDTPSDALMVTYFTRNKTAGLEYGNNAVMIEGFASTPMMTNQEALLVVDGVPQYDPFNFEQPNLDGGPIGAPGRVGGDADLYDSVIRRVLGASSISNDWSNNQSDAFGVNTDWVVTIPGQYLMVDIETLATTGACAAGSCDTRDIPVRARVKFYDREETSFTPEDGDLVVSPATTITNGTDLVNEVNVITWSDTPVLGSQYAQKFEVAIDGASSGWAELSVTSSAAKAPQQVWAADPNATGSFSSRGDVVNTAPPIIGFAVWSRNFGDDETRNYGRAVDHAYGS
ncbi:MAG: hypothetical protein ABJ056_04335 [Halioglobus sp.]